MAAAPIAELIDAIRLEPNYLPARRDLLLAWATDAPIEGVARYGFAPTIDNVYCLAQATNDDVREWLEQSGPRPKATALTDLEGELPHSPIQPCLVRPELLNRWQPPDGEVLTQAQSPPAGPARELPPPAHLGRLLARGGPGVPGWTTSGSQEGAPARAPRIGSIGF